MLRELVIQNLVLIEDTQLQLGKGFTAWTGETGAGKSLLLNALGFLLGQRSGSDLLRCQDKDLRVSARFQIHSKSLQDLLASQFPSLNVQQELILCRKASPSGTSRAYCQNEPITLQQLKKMGEMLIHIQGQREANQILDPDYQMQLIDSYGSTAILRQDYERVSRDLLQLREQLHQWEEQQSCQLRQREQHDYELEELTQANLQRNEWHQLQQEHERLLHAQGLFQFAQQFIQHLSDAEGAILPHLGRLQKQTEHWQKVDTRWQEVSHRLQPTSAMLKDLVRDARSWSESYQADPWRLQEVQSRLYFLEKLQTRYRKTLDELIDHREELKSIKQQYQQLEYQRPALISSLEEKFNQWQQSAIALRNARIQAAKKLVQRMENQLRDLGMPRAKLEVGVHTVSHAKSAVEGPVPMGGWDKLELLLAANPGDAAAPLRQIASGGELSRTLLACKTVLAEHESVSTLIFDEIDANIGGRLGEVIGRQLASLAQHHQVIVITHLPQVASFAEQQWTVRKLAQAKKTQTTIALLTQIQDRVEELAQMLRGSSVTDRTRKEAKDMLLAARTAERSKHRPRKVESWAESQPGNKSFSA